MSVEAVVFDLDGVVVDSEPVWEEVRRKLVAVEDSSNGIRAAVAAGLPTIAIARPQYPVDPEALGAAAVRLTDIDQLTVEVVGSAAPGHQ